MIIHAKHEHLPEIDSIYNQAIEDGMRTAHLSPLSRQERLAWFEAHSKEDHPVFVWMENEKVRGWLSISPYRSGRGALGEVAEVSYYVDFNHHNRGIATELLEYGIAFCKSSSIRILVAILISGNTESFGLLKKFGFEESGRIKNAIHYKDIFRDHVYASLMIN